MISSETTVDVPLLQQFDDESHEALPVFHTGYTEKSNIKKTWISLQHLPSTVARCTKNILPTWRSLLPSWSPSTFVRSSNKNLAPASPPAVPSPTAYMSGLRGVASLLVFIHHYVPDYFEQLEFGWHARPQDTSVFQLPIVRILYSGRFMVTLFFVLSGYVLSHKPIKLARKGNSAGIHDTLASSVFRRWVRLFVPILLSTFLTMLCIHFGWYGSFNKKVRVPKILPFGQQCKIWFIAMARFLDPLAYRSGNLEYGSQLWTLPIEFRGSMLVFLTVLGLSHAKTAIRMSTVFAFAYFCLYASKDWQNWDMFLFISGIFLAEWQIIRSEATSSRAEVLLTNQKSRVVNSGSKILWFCLFLVSLWLACWPDIGSDKSPGYIFLSSITPERFPAGDAGRTRFWTSLAAPMMLLALDNLPFLQRIFNTPLMEYLGELSFSLYIVHAPLLYTFGRAFSTICINFTGSKFLGFLLGACVNIPVIFWAADVYWRLVDAKTVEFGRWMWKTCSVSKA